MARKTSDIDDAPALGFAEQQADAIYELNVDQVHSSDLNPREKYSTDSLKSLAKSIEDDGLIQPIMVKRILNDDGSLSHYEIVAGERRWRAIKNILKHPTIRATIADGEITNVRHKRLALIENLQRENLNPIEVARGIQWLCEEGGLKQKDVARELKISPASVTNHLHLLDLPDRVQSKIEAGQLSQTVARHLAPLADFPKIIDAYVNDLIPENGITSKDFENESLPGLWDLHRDNLLVIIPHSAPAFNWQKQCAANCPHGAYLATKDGKHVCLRPDHYQELQGEAHEKKEKAEQRKASKAQEKVQAVMDAKTADNEDTPRPIDPKDLPKLSDLPYNSYVRLEQKDEGVLTKIGCSEKCACRGTARDHGDRVVPVCFDPKRYQSLQRTNSLQENKGKREKHLKAFNDAAAFVRSTRVIPNRLLIALFRGTLQSHQLSRDKLAGYLTDLGLSLTVDDIRTERGDIKLSVINKITPVDLVRLVGWHMINEEHNQSKRYPDFNMPCISILTAEEVDQELTFDEEEGSRVEVEEAISQELDSTSLPATPTEVVESRQTQDGVPEGWRIEQVEKRSARGKSGKRAQPVTLYRCVNDQLHIRTLTHSMPDEAIADIPNGIEFNDGDDTVDGITIVASHAIEEVSA